jgi:hypothetical protein
MPRKPLPKGEKIVTVAVPIQEKVLEKLGKEYCQMIGATAINNQYKKIVK